MKPTNLNDLIRIEDALRVLCRKTCTPGIACPDGYCVEMWEEFEDVKRVDAVPIVRCGECKYWHDIIPWRISVNNKSWNYCQKRKDTMPEDGYCHLAQRQETNEIVGESGGDV